MKNSTIEEFAEITHRICNLKRWLNPYSKSVGITEHDLQDELLKKEKEFEMLVIRAALKIED